MKSGILFFAGIYQIGGLSSPYVFFLLLLYSYAYTYFKVRQYAMWNPFSCFYRSLLFSFPLYIERVALGLGTAPGACGPGKGDSQVWEHEAAEL